MEKAKETTRTIAINVKAGIKVGMALIIIAGALEVVNYIELPEIARFVCGGVIGVYAIAELIKGSVK